MDEMHMWLNLADLHDCIVLWHTALFTSRLHHLKIGNTSSRFSICYKHLSVVYSSIVFARSNLKLWWLLG